MPRSRRRRTRWLAAAAVLLLAGAVAGAVAAVRIPDDTSAASPTGPDPRSTVRAFTLAWQVGDLNTMYSLLSRASHHEVSLNGFRRAYDAAAATATLEHVKVVGRIRVSRSAASLTVDVRTTMFGNLRVPVRLPLVLGRHGYRITWVPSLTFPGLDKGERLARRERAPKTRGMIRAHDGEILAEGPATDRVYPQGSSFAVVTGYVKAPTPAQARSRARHGWPASLPFGQGGLEKSLDAVLAGSPRIKLMAVSKSGRRTVAVHPGRAPHDVRTTLQLPLQEAAATALGARYGGVVVLSTKTGAVEADVGLGMDALQPPGSSFKTVTAAAALQAGVATLDSTYAYARYVVLNGWHLRNFHHEDCGGSLLLAFAVSCNSVFAPLADQVGAKRLVQMAEAFGFNHKPTIAYPAPTSVTRRAADMPSDLSLGVAGIGQGGVDATALQMASVAQTIGSLGIQRPPHIVYSPATAADAKPQRRVIPAPIAAQVRTMMEAVVTEGTGTAAAISGVTVAGKTGTAEVGDRPSDAWFIAFAPAVRPRVAVAVLVVNGGVGGEVAAPIARDVLSAALGLG